MAEYVAAALGYALAAEAAALEDGEAQDEAIQRREDASYALASTEAPRPWVGADVSVGHEGDWIAVVTGKDGVRWRVRVERAT